MAFFDAFCEQAELVSVTVTLAIDQGSHRRHDGKSSPPAFCWKLFMGIPEVQTGLRKARVQQPSPGNDRCMIRLRTILPVELNCSHCGETRLPQMHDMIDRLVLQDRSR